MISLLRSAWRRLRALLGLRPPFCPEEDPNRPSWAREAWKRAQRRGYRSDGAK